MSALAEAAAELDDLKKRVTELEALVNTMRALNPVTGSGLPRTAYTVSEVAELLGRNTDTVRRLIAEGHLAAEKVNNWWSIPRESVERLVRGRAA